MPSDLSYVPTGTAARPVWARVSLPLIAFLCAALAVVLPIMAYPHLPAIDLPNHIARYHIIAHAGDGGPLDRFYEYEFSFAPNAAADLIWLALGTPGSPERFAQIVMALYGVGFIGAMMVLSRVLHGRWMAWPAASALLVFNICYYWGFQNYLVTMPFAVLALALWLAVEDRRVGLRLALFVPVALALYLMHFFAFCFLAIAAFGREMQRLAGSGTGWRARLWPSLVMALPFLLPVLWLAASVVGGPASAAGSRTEYPGLAGQIVALLVAPMAAFSAAPGMFVKASAYTCYGAILLCFLTLRRETGPRLQLANAMKGPLWALVVAATFAPLWLNGVALVNVRLPFMIIALIIASTSWQGLGQAGRIVVAAFFTGLVLLGDAGVARFSRDHSADVDDLTSLLQHLPEGARLLPVRTEAMADDLRLSHIQAYAVVQRNAFVPTLFQGVHDIRVKEEWRDASHPALAGVSEVWLTDQAPEKVTQNVPFVTGWQQKFNYVLLVDPSDRPLKIADQLEEVARTGRFTLFHIKGAER